ncbi:MAG: mRNA-degrading endonuclease [Candidatus Taylorbacteria bacterium RIFCSPHIGHO2_02_49_25]|uniref:mRNA-degrading endonuclease n=1 Tax=Candidatus Taylorbacteria bacterium RIFCSPHIGHO2_02_49_25 TaxID=1802305 RepID=A0A1G2MFN7_9BACT|nr:MAG: Growth inhibitor [Parcubacteria group bacterium GW2011_GWF2_50_9]OHA21045.1 MAG: mRNA-degrading endonuclease [Candidatus Taylorbacteria bacterium RIFCSPHIGHO2_01_FULL_49_60]OHA22643.1 MAG: mRNA-degrading endonuclease [Candidatus Taylorbacteria bacterium RIFCSPHIGHO2_02_49_25]OHA36235.1 MAG: mRNA-degrading endonuclease [Candidatus Taylorbacteria bacterium RIFCSPLOWO2_01_FULL_50_130]OHA36529.1 MAG: mRNA-degrading endonuclease [Candidatus Taylorbacteria bacterium RIFCSPLOWO2_02_50_13]OHA4
MVRRSYIPERGDIVYLTFDPVEGHEQGGRRPAVVLSSRKYNERIGLATVCPVTSRIKGYPFEVSLFLQGRISMILCDHLRSVAWKKRRATFITSASFSVLSEVIRKIELLLTQ